MVARLRDCLLYNVNYPLRIFDGPSPFYVPAKHFPVPYSWDGGFIALGLATFAPERAFQQLAYYMTDAKHGVPFLYCASPVPTMLYALWDLHQATGDRAHLERAWDGARRMYDFYLGRSPDGICNAAGDGLLSTYAVYGNLGMDDHPIQRWAEQHHVTGQGLYSLILIAQVLRLARVMRVIAALLGHDAYAGQCRRDADLLAGVIDGRMWDEESGLYGWLCRTERGVERPLVGGSRGDRSACAFLPLFAGQMTHKDRLLPQLADPDRFLTPNGVSSMDMQSPLYNPDGYWNGGIWPVLQWYLWRGLLEAGEPALARRVAQAILDAWQRSYDTEHYLGEHFCIARNRMSGAPNFGGLSAALLPMHAAYFTPYAVTPLYDIAVTRREADPARDTLALTLCAPVPGAPVHDLLVNMGRPRAPYAVLVNGHPAAGGLSDDFGHLTLRLPRPDPQDAVLIRPG
jgi:glycogen debranching enzyme